MGFAIPVDAVRRSLRELRAERRRVDYGYLGVTSLSLYPQLAERLGADGDRRRAGRSEVEEGSPADDAGLRAGDDKIAFQGQPDIVTGGDVILAVDGEQLTRSHDLTDLISALRRRRQGHAHGVRDGERRTVKVELGRRPGGSGS